MRVQNIMGGKAVGGVFTIPPDRTVAEAAAILAERRIGALIVSSDGRRPEGILSERDIVRELGRRGATVLGERVAGLMTRNLVTCSPADDSVDIVGRMTEGRFRHMPVLEGGEMVGLISIGDVVKARLGELAMERDALESMIMGN